MTFLSIFGVFLGVSIPIVTMSVMGGLQKEIKDKILGLKGHIVLVPPVFGKLTLEEDFLRQLRSIEGIQSVIPIIEVQGLVHLFEEYEPVILRGIPQEIFETDPSFKTLYQVQAGEADFSRMYFANVGSELAKVNFLNVGERIHILTARKLNDFASGQKSLTLHISGFFKTGFLEFDNGIIFTSLATLQKAYGLEAQATQVEIKLKDEWQAAKIAAILEKQFPEKFRIYTWKDLNYNFFKALALEKAGLWSVLTLILIVAVFNVMSGQIMSVLEKRREIGILKTLGFGPKKIASIFLFEGLITTGIGACLGAVAGVLLALNLGRCIAFIEAVANAIKSFLSMGTSLFWPDLISEHPIEIIPQGIYYVDAIPVQLSWELVGGILLCAFLFSMVAGMVPAFQAGQLKTIEVIRHE